MRPFLPLTLLVFACSTTRPDDATTAHGRDAPSGGRAGEGGEETGGSEEQRGGSSVAGDRAGSTRVQVLPEQLGGSSNPGAGGGNTPPEAGGTESGGASLAPGAGGASLGAGGTSSTAAGGNTSPFTTSGVGGETGTVGGAGSTGTGGAFDGGSDALSVLQSVLDCPTGPWHNCDGLRDYPVERVCPSPQPPNPGILTCLEGECPSTPCVGDSIYYCCKR